MPNALQVFDNSLNDGQLCVCRIVYVKACCAIACYKLNGVVGVHRERQQATLAHHFNTIFLVTLVCNETPAATSHHATFKLEGSTYGVFNAI